MKKLIALIEKLRSPDGCNWDRKQKLTDIANYLKEEIEELNQAILSDNPGNIAEECGDVLLLIGFIIVILKEKKQFTYEDILDCICNKIIERHPHVFKETKSIEESDVIFQWDKIKKQEEVLKDKSGFFKEIPVYLSALRYAELVQKLASNVGFDWSTKNEVFEKLKEEVNELEVAMNKEDLAMQEHELGDLLFSCINLSRFIKVNPENALKLSTTKFIKRFNYILQRAKTLGKKIEDLSFQEMDSLWDEIRKNKANEI